MEKKYCLNCGKELVNKWQTKFCSQSCSASYSNRNRKHTVETKARISESLKKNYTEEEKEKILTTKEKYVPKNNLKYRLIKLGLKENRCECCGNMGSWMGTELILQLHHKDGNHKNNSIENLQILCPNCHSQTDTYCDKNRKVKKTKKEYCSICGKEICRNNMTGLCVECYNKKQKRKINVTETELREEFQKCKNYSLLAEKYNVHPRTIKKWLIKYQII